VAIIRNRLALILIITFIAIFVFRLTPALSSEKEVIAYYFHSNFRCVTCRTMEQYSREAIEENFKDELSSGKLVFKTVNIDEKENKHFVNDYDLYTKSLVLSKVVDGKEAMHKNLTKIWEYARNKDMFFTYVVDEIKDYLKE